MNDMKKLLTLSFLIFHFSFLASYAQNDIWIDINGVRDLTADSIENWPRKVRSSRRLSSLRLVENQDGTVSLVGKVAAIGLGIRLR